MMEIQMRAMANANARKSFSEASKKAKPSAKVVSIGDAITTIDQVLDKVGNYENVKITALTELLLALESGDTKNLIEFLKAKEPVATSKKKVKKEVWKL